LAKYWVRTIAEAAILVPGGCANGLAKWANGERDIEWDLYFCLEALGLLVGIFGSEVFLLCGMDETIVCAQKGQGLTNVLLDDGLNN
jgi:hypothetical protein